MEKYNLKCSKAIKIKLPHSHRPKVCLNFLQSRKIFFHLLNFVAVAGTSSSTLAAKLNFYGKPAIPKYILSVRAGSKPK